LNFKVTYGQGMMKIHRFIAACLICSALVAPVRAQSADSADNSEYLIKAGFTYNFAKLMDWPATAFPQPNSPIVIGILGTDPFGGTLDQVLRGKQANGRDFEIKHLKWGMDVRDCDILFISSSEGAHVDEVLHAVHGLPVLTIGEMPGFAQRGGIINFILEDNKVRFEVNVDAAKQANINISSRLLSLAKIVQQPDGKR
jgi:hypothetical protein